MTIIQILQEHFTRAGKLDKLVAGNEFNGVLLKDFLQKENVEVHFTKAHSHTGIADMERFHETVVEKF